MLLDTIAHHYLSHDKVSRPTVSHALPPVNDPVNEFSACDFYQLSGFWPEQFEEVLSEVTKVNDPIICRRTRCRASLKLALFVLLRRWAKPDTWDDVRRCVRRKRTWCMLVCEEVFKQLRDGCQLCVRVLDYRRLTGDLLELWSDTIHNYTGAERDVLYLADGKPWRLSRPGKGEAAQHFARAAGSNDVNLVQQAHYNGHYGFHGAKVQHVLQADGMTHSFTCSIRRHDSVVMLQSDMLLMISILRVGDDPNRPAILVTDKAYGRSEFLHPLHTEAELAAMDPPERIEAQQQDECNRKPRLAVEDSFKDQLVKFSHVDFFKTHRVLQDGKSNWDYVRDLWDMQVFFYNLFTCAQNHGSQVTGALGVEPPSVAEYLCSANNNLLVQPPPLLDKPKAQAFTRHPCV